MTMFAFWRKHFLPVELGASVLLTAALYFALQVYDSNTGFVSLLKGSRVGLYAALTAVFGSLLGFAITAISIVIGFSQAPQLKVVRESEHYFALWRVFTSAIRALAFSTAIAIVALVADRDDSPRILLLYLCVFAFLLSSFRLARVIWVLERVVRLVA